MWQQTGFGPWTCCTNVRYIFLLSLFLNRTDLLRLLVGEGARSWASERGISTLDDGEQDLMITGTCSIAMFIRENGF